MSDYVYELMKKHHSVRRFKTTPLSQEIVEKLVGRGQSASTSSFYKHIQSLVLMTLKLKKI